MLVDDIPYPSERGCMCPSEEAPSRRLLLEDDVIEWPVSPIGAAKQEDDDDIASVARKMEELAGIFMVSGCVLEILV